MSKLPIAIAIFIIFFNFSCQKKEETPLLAEYLPEEKVLPLDSSLINIPMTLELYPVSDAYTAEKEKAIAEFYTKKIGLSDFSGALLVSKNGKIIFEDYKGYANYASKTPISKTTALHLASVSKVMTATLVLKLVQENKIDLNEKVQTYLPDFPYQNTTVKTLLNHRSGLPHYSRFSESVKGWNTKKTITNEDVLDYLKRYKFALLAKNDTKFNYCNTNYVMLALIIEKVTGKKYAEAMQEQIFSPLGMNDTFVIDFVNQKNTVSQSYKTNYVNHGWDQFDAIYGDKNIYSTPRDLVKFDLATYATEFLRKDLWEEALKGYSYEKKGIKNYGLGIRLREWGTGQTLHYHNGWWHGNTSSYTTLKNDTIVIIALSNKYTRKTYQAMKLSALFGDYPFELDEQN
ncbi:MAG: beta-lactamase family protein [Flavobacterium sp.]|uniref:serine hydrolase domain-containing protein n=1 Tax=Flavobacterium sp. TaxID=239 RepID=UPI001DA805C3|nr:beta-lactamase family protein [Flavobacterium sp.]